MLDTQRKTTAKYSRGYIFRGGSRTAATSKMERFVIIVNDWKPLIIITKHFILDVAAVLDLPLYKPIKRKEGNFQSKI